MVWQRIPIGGVGLRDEVERLRELDRAAFHQQGGKDDGPVAELRYGHGQTNCTSLDVIVQAGSRNGKSAKSLAKITNGSKAGSSDGSLRASWHHGLQPQNTGQSAWHIKEADVKGFLRRHPEELNGRNVDLVAVVDILAGIIYDA